MKSFFRPNIERMSGYVPGKQPQQPGYIKLNTNESPYPPSPRVLRCLREAVGENLRLYPDPMANALRRKAAEVYRVPQDCILAGNGSDDLLTVICRAFVGPKRIMAFPWPTYSLYPTLAKIENSRIRRISFPKDFSLPDKLCRRGAAVTFIANPNSPSSTFIPVADLRRLARRISGVLVVDEAYVDFANDSALRLIERNHNVIVLRTFSKSFSLCGIRLGLAFAHEDLISGMAKVKDSYNVHRLAIVAGVAALEDIAWMQRNAERIRRTRQRLTEALESLGWFVYPSQSNFVFCRVTGAKSAEAIYRELKRRKIFARWFSEPVVADGLRITIGSSEEITALIRNLRDIVGM